MKAKSDGRNRTCMVLTEVEKLDGRYPRLAFSVKAYLDQGISAEDTAKVIRETFAVPLTASAVASYRTRRWVPEKELVALKMATTKAAVEAFGGDAGFDAVLLAKLWELMDEMTIPQLLAARSLFLRVRAQNLKEQEFLFKTGQLKPAPTEGEDADPHAQQKKVLQRIKEIFGLAGDEPPKVAVAQLPEATEGENA